MKADQYQSLSLQLGLGLGTDLRYRYQALIKLQGIPIPNKQMYTSSASLCLPPIAIEIIVIRPLTIKSQSEFWSLLLIAIDYTT